MTVFRQRFPAWEDLRLAFAGCVFVIHVWAILNLLDALPAFLLRLTPYEVAGVISYPLVFALLESLLVWSLVVLAAIVFPRRWLRGRFLTRGMALVLFTALFSIAIHFNYEDLVKNLQYLPLWASIYLILTLICVYWVGRSQHVDAILRAALQRIEVLSYLYIFMDVFGLFIVISRNILSNGT